jgi:hypothetical protein
MNRAGAGKELRRREAPSPGHLTTESGYGSFCTAIGDPDLSSKGDLLLDRHSGPASAPKHSTTGSQWSPRCAAWHQGAIARVDCNKCDPSSDVWRHGQHGAHREMS